MVYEAQKIGTVIDLGDIYQVRAPLDKQLIAFEKVGIHTLASLDEVAKIRIAGVSDEYSRTCMAPIAIGGGNTILVRDSPLMNHAMAAAAVNAHKEKRYFITGKELYESMEALAKSQESMAPEERGAIILPENKHYLDLTPEMDASRFIFREQNKSYFDNFGRGTIPLYNLLVYPKDVATINYTWFNPPQYGSGIACFDGDLYCDLPAVAVLRNSAEQSARCRE